MLARAPILLTSLLLLLFLRFFSLIIQISHGDRVTDVKDGRRYSPSIPLPHLTPQPCYYNNRSVISTRRRPAAGHGPNCTLRFSDPPHESIDQRVNHPLRAFHENQGIAGWLTQPSDEPGGEAHTSALPPSPPSLARPRQSPPHSITSRYNCHANSIAPFFRIRRHPLSSSQYPIAVSALSPLSFSPPLLASDYRFVSGYLLLFGLL